MLWCHAYRVRTGAAQMTHARQPFHNFWWPEARYARPIFYGCAMAAHTLAFSHALAGASHAAEGGLRAFAHCLFPLWVPGDCSVLLGDAGRRLEQHRLGCGRVRLDLVSGVLAAFRVGLKFTRGDAKEQAHRGERDRRARRADGAAACRADQRWDQPPTCSCADQPNHARLCDDESTLLLLGSASTSLCGDDAASDSLTFGEACAGISIRGNAAVQAP